MLGYMSNSMASQYKHYGPRIHLSAACATHGHEENLVSVYSQAAKHRHLQLCEICVPKPANLSFIQDARRRLSVVSRRSQGTGVSARKR